VGPGDFSRSILLSYDTTIREVKSLSPGTPLPDNCIRAAWLTPGFINAHCHLEYTWLADAMPRGNIPFGEWMRAIMSRRANTPQDIQQRETGMVCATAELLKGGCTTVIDSSTDGRSAAHFAEAGIRHFLFHEVLGLTTERAEPMYTQAMGRCAGPGNGLNPHAPYSVGAWLREQIRNLESPVPIAWHLAETPDEEALFQTGTGSIGELLKDFSLPLPYYKLPHTSSYGFLEQENLTGSCMLAFHGNELSDDEASHFKAPRGLVHCPSTHEWFQRMPVNLSHWLAQGVNVCLGTDSRASSDTLSMRKIIRLAAESCASLSADQLLTMACHNPARLPFLKEMGLTGTLTPGSPADFVCLHSDLPDSSWYEMLTSSKTKLDKVIIRGKAV